MTEVKTCTSYNGLAPSCRTPHLILLFKSLCIGCFSHSQSHPRIPTSVLNVRKWHRSTEIVLLDTGVAPLCSRRIGGIPSRSRNVHADHVPEIPLQSPSVVVRRSCWGRMGHRFCLHHGHVHRAQLLRTAAVWHGTAGERKRNKLNPHFFIFVGKEIRTKASSLRGFTPAPLWAGNSINVVWQHFVQTTIGRTMKTTN